MPAVLRVLDVKDRTKPKEIGRYINERMIRKTASVQQRRHRLQSCLHCR